MSVSSELGTSKPCVSRELYSPEKLSCSFLAIYISKNIIFTLQAFSLFSEDKVHASSFEVINCCVRIITA